MNSENEPPVFITKSDITRSETPWHLADGHGNFTDPTGGPVWSTRGHRWERLFRSPSMAIGGPAVENLWPPMENLWRPVKINNFWSVNLVCGTFKCRKNGNNYMQFSRKFCYNVFRKSNYAIKSAKLRHFRRYGCRISFKRHSRLNGRKYFGNKGFLRSKFWEISYELLWCSFVSDCHLVAKFVKDVVDHCKGSFGSFDAENIHLV